MNQSVFLFKGVQNAVKAELYRTIKKYTYIYIVIDTYSIWEKKKLENELDTG